MKVILSRKVFYQIKHSLTEACNSYEVGGLLLGHKMLNSYFIIAATVPDVITDKSITSFILDGNKHTESAIKTMQYFQYEPTILGVWHSHICDTAIFSEQDRQANKQLAIFLKGALSMITTMPVPNQRLNFTTYFITAKGKEHRCQTKIDFYNRKIPSHFME